MGVNLSSPRWGRAFLAVYYLILATLLLYVGFFQWAYDDPYISYRYANNLAHGLGFVYNVGERVLSTTTPLFTLLLAVGGRIWRDLPTLANLIGAFSLALGAVFLWALARSWRTPTVGWAALLIYPTFPLLISTLGSEMPLYLAFCLGALTFYARRRYTWAAAFVALATLTRPDGILLAAPLTLDFLIRRRRPIPWAAPLVFLALTLPWFAFAWGYFGSPLPVTLAAKQHQGAMLISQRFAPGLLTIASDYFTPWHYRLEGLWLVLGFVLLLWRKRQWLLLLSWTLLYFVAYSFLGVSRYYWYFAPLVPGFVVLVGLGLTVIIEMPRRPLVAGPAWREVSNGRRFSPLVRRFLGMLSANFDPRFLWIAILLLPLFLGQVLDLWHLRGNFYPRATMYRTVGEWLRAASAADASVGALEVGILGYYAQRPMIDFAGLIQPQVAKQLTPQGSYEDAALWAADHYRPDYLVLFEGAFPRLMQGYVAQFCTLAMHFPGEPYGLSEAINVFACPRP